jgi:transposase-like protein
MATYRTYSIAFKRQLVEEYLSGASLKALSRRYDVGRALIRLWTRKAEAGDFADERVTAELLREYETRVEVLERLAGKQALELEFLKRALELAASRPGATPSIVVGPPASASQEDAG